MKRIYTFLFVTMAMLMLSVSSAWAQYVKLTAEDGTESWIEIEGTINDTNIEIYKGWRKSTIDNNTKGFIDLNEVWSRSGGIGTNYQVTSIGNYAFYDCSSLTSVVIPSSVTSIKESAFEGCSGLTSVVIPSSVTNIGYCAFFGCSGLTSVDIPSSVTSIGDVAFSGCSGLTSVDIPSSVTSIGNAAFSGCRGLTSVVIPSNVTSIGDEAFSVCIGLTSIVVESGNSVYDSRNNCNAIIETASNSLIAGCKNTKIPSSVTSIGIYAFSGCSGLISVDIPSSVTSIGGGAFSGCSGLTSVVIPSSVISIWTDTFSGCSGLTSFVVESGNPVYDSRNNCNAIIETASNTLIAGCKNTMIPSSVTDIEGRAFYGCSGLTSIEIPSSVTSIGNYAFYDCSGLTSITSYITEVFETGYGAFFGCENATLYVPRGLANTYRSKAHWNRFNNIVESIPLAMSCNNKGKVTVNGGIQFTNNVGEVSVYDGTDNTFVFTPEENCQLEQVLIDGLDVTLSVKNNQLTTKVHEGSKMIVTFSKSSGDMNGDGQVNISDVVALVNLILGQ